MTGSGATPHRRLDHPAALHFTEIPAQAQQLPFFRGALTRWATLTGLPQGTVQDLVIAAYEAMANVVTHAYPTDEPGYLWLHATRDADGHVVVTVADHGHWRPMPLETSSGRGLPLIEALADEVHLHHDARGTTIRMLWKLP